DALPIWPGGRQAGNFRRHGAGGQRDLSLWPGPPPRPWHFCCGRPRQLGEKGPVYKFIRFCPYLPGWNGWTTTFVKPWQAMQILAGRKPAREVLMGRMARTILCLSLIITLTLGASPARAWWIFGGGQATPTPEPTQAAIPEPTPAASAPAGEEDASIAPGEETAGEEEQGEQGEAA